MNNYSSGACETRNRLLPVVVYTLCDVSRAPAPFDGINHGICTSSQKVQASRHGRRLSVTLQVPTAPEHNLIAGRGVLEGRIARPLANQEL